MNRPAPVKPDNFFIMIFHALRQRRVPLVLRIASHSLLLVMSAVNRLDMTALSMLERLDDGLAEHVVHGRKSPRYSRRWHGGRARWQR